MLNGDQLLLGHLGVEIMILYGNVLDVGPQLGKPSKLNGTHIVLKDLASNSWDSHGNTDMKGDEFIQQLHGVIISRRAVAKAMHLASVVESATIICSLELQIKGH
jgi:hypothetical protein